MKISDYVEWGLLGGVLLCSIIMAIIVLVSNINIAMLVFSTIALVLIAAYKVIEILKSKGVIKW